VPAKSGHDLTLIEKIQSPRLDLIPMTPAFMKASLADDLHGADRELGASLPAGWPDKKNRLAVRLEQLENDPTLQPWLLRAMCVRESRAMIGHIGFHTAPGAEYLREWLPGAIEFGYMVFPPYRRQGFAREAARALMQWACDVHGVTRFVLTIAPGNTASQALAASLGFARIGEHLDEVDGIEDVLGLELAV
jgi:[ribosomal protein S5]-alanine N-acetyltransferase